MKAQLLHYFTVVAGMSRRIYLGDNSNVERGSNEESNRARGASNKQSVQS